MAHDLFISYSSQDKAVADAVCSVLESANIRCWIAPRDILPSQGWADAIVDAVTESRVMVLIFSSNSNDSKHVKKELALAINANVIIIPMRIEDIPLEGTMEYYLSDTHWLDAMNPPTEKHFQELTSIALRLVPDRKIDHKAQRPSAEEPEEMVGKEDEYEPSMQVQDGLKSKDKGISVLGKKMPLSRIVPLALLSVTLIRIIIAASMWSGFNARTQATDAPTLAEDSSAQLPRHSSTPDPIDTLIPTLTVSPKPSPTESPDYLGQFVQPLMTDLSSTDPAIGDNHESSWDDLANAELYVEMENEIINVEADNAFQKIFALGFYNMALQFDLTPHELTRDTILGFEINRRTIGNRLRRYHISLNPSTGDWHFSIEGEDPIAEGVIDPLTVGEIYPIQLIALEKSLAFVVDDSLVFYHQADDLPSSVHLSEGNCPGFDLSSPTGKTALSIEKVRYWNLNWTRHVQGGGDWVDTILQPAVDFSETSNPHYQDNFTGEREDWASATVRLRSFDQGNMPLAGTSDKRFDIMNMVGRWTEFMLEFDLIFETYGELGHLRFGPFGNPSLEVLIRPADGQVEAKIYDPSSDENELLGTWEIEIIQKNQPYHWTMIITDNHLLLFRDQALVLKADKLPDIAGFFRIQTDELLQGRMEQFQMWNLTRMQ